MTEIDYDDGEKYINDESIELAWAIKAAERANVHMNLICACNTKILRLNKAQDQIVKAFREHFPSLDVRKVTEKELKDDGNKEKWRAFCELFQESVEDYSMGTLLRIEAKYAYSPENTVVAPRIIFLAIESARNIEGINEECKASYTAHHKTVEQSF